MEVTELRQLFTLAEEEGTLPQDCINHSAMTMTKWNFGFAGYGDWLIFDASVVRGQQWDSKRDPAFHYQHYWWV